MALLVLCVLALLVAGGLADPAKPVLQKPADKTTLNHQYKLLVLLLNIYEPNYVQEHKDIENSWNIEKNAQLYENATAVRIVSQSLQHQWNLPKAVPFSILEETHKTEAQFIFNLLFSAKDFETFYKTAVYLRPYLNEYLYVYVLSAVIYHRHDTQNIIVPPLYSIMPSFFRNTQILKTAERIAIHGEHLVEHLYPSTYLWDNNVVINQNGSLWPVMSDEDFPISYFTHDPALSDFYYSTHLTYPFWLGKETCPLIKDRRGEIFWAVHRQILARYYMERLSNDLGEIPELDDIIIHQGYTPSLGYMNGLAFPYRPNHYNLDAPETVELLRDIILFERRIREVIDKGFMWAEDGSHVDIRSPDSIDLLGRLVEANVDSPNVNYYKDFVSIWKKILGNSPVSKASQYYKGMFNLVLPSALEHYQTTLRDPAFYMITKRVLNLFKTWHESLPSYTQKELALPSVRIEKVDVDKLVTYFENTYMNVTNHLPLNEPQYHNTKSVLVKYHQLNHKVFTVRVNVNSEAQKHVTVRFFLAPKYDSNGNDIPLFENTYNFFLLDEFEYMLQQGENVIVRSSDENLIYGLDVLDGHELLHKVQDALHGGQFMWNAMRKPNHFVNRLVLPKGRVGGMPFVLMVYISEYKAPNVVYGTGFDPVSSLGLGTGAHRLTADPLLFPVDRPLHTWQVQSLTNMWFQDVVIYHKHTPEIIAHTI